MAEDKNRDLELIRIRARARARAAAAAKPQEPEKPSMVERVGGFLMGTSGRDYQQGYIDQTREGYSEESLAARDSAPVFGERAASYVLGSATDEVRGLTARYGQNPALAAANLARGAVGAEPIPLIDPKAAAAASRQRVQERRAENPIGSMANEIGAQTLATAGAAPLLRAAGAGLTPAQNATQRAIDLGEQMIPRAKTGIGRALQRWKVTKAARAGAAGGAVEGTLEGDGSADRMAKMWEGMGYGALFGTALYGGTKAAGAGRDFVTRARGADAPLPKPERKARRQVRGLVREATGRRADEVEDIYAETQNEKLLGRDAIAAEVLNGPGISRLNQAAMKSPHARDQVDETLAALNSFQQMRMARDAFSALETGPGRSQERIEALRTAQADEAGRAYNHFRSAGEDRIAGSMPQADELGSMESLLQTAGMRLPDDTAERLSTFVRRQGGISTEDADLRQISDRLFGDNGIRRKNGRDADMMREAAVEAGFLPEDATLNDFYRALDEDLRGNPQTRRADAGAGAARSEAEQARYSAEREAGRLGLDPDRPVSPQQALELANPERFAMMRARREGLQPLIERPSFEKAVDYAKKQLKDDGRPDAFSRRTPEGKWEELPPEAWGPDLHDAIYKRLEALRDDAMEKVAQGYPSAKADQRRYQGLLEAHRRFLDGAEANPETGAPALPAAFPEYRGARETFARYAEPIEAVEQGRKAFDTREKDLSEIERFERYLATLRSENLPDFRTGVADALDLTIRSKNDGKAGPQQNAAAALVGSPLKRQALERAVNDPEKARQLIEDFTDESRIFTRRSWMRPTGNSKTAINEEDASGDGMGALDMAAVGLDLAGTSGKAAATRLAMRKVGSWLSRRLTKPDLPMEEEVARLLLMDPDRLLSALSKQEADKLVAEARGVVERAAGVGARPAAALGLSEEERD